MGDTPEENGTEGDTQHPQHRSASVSFQCDKFLGLLVEPKD